MCLLTTDIYKNKHCVKYYLILRSNCFFNIEDSCLTLTIIQASISCRYHKHQVICYTRFKNNLKINLSLFESTKNVHIEFNGNDTSLE